MEVETCEARLRPPIGLQAAQTCRKRFSSRSYFYPTCPYICPLYYSFLISFLLLIFVPNVYSQRGIKQQRFAIEPTDRTAIVGDRVVLACRVVDKVGPLQWTRDGFGLGTNRNLSGFSRYSMIGSDEEGDYSLHISSVTLEDDAVFQCQVGARDNVKPIRSRSAVFTVFVPPEPPRIIQGDHLKTTAGMTVELTCVSDGGKPAAELSWLDGEGNVVTHGVEYKREVQSDGKRANAALTWTFSPSRHHDGRIFTCRSENPALKQPMYAEIRMHVRYPPDISLTVENEKVMENEDVRFHCEAHANPDNVEYRWYKNDEPIAGDHKNTLTLKRVNRTHNGATITCEVRNEVGVTKSTHTLNVHYPPHFRSHEETVAAQLGTDVALSCEVDGNPKPDIVWIREGSQTVLGKQSTYVIRGMQSDDTGKYTCRATVPGFQEITNEVTVYIKGPPHVMSSPLQYAVEGQEVRIECLIESLPPPNKVSWAKDGQQIEIDNNRGIELKQDVLPNGIRSWLVIHKVLGADFGLYNCSVSNTFGTDSLVIALRPQRNFSMFVIMVGATAGAISIVFLAIIVIFCMRKKSNNKGAEFGDSKAKPLPTVAVNGDSGSSGGESDLKVEIRTTSSLSNNDAHVNDHSWDNTLPSDATVAYKSYNNLHSNNDYVEGPLYQQQPKSNDNSTHNNNGYIPSYADYLHSGTPLNNSYSLGSNGSVSGTYTANPAVLSYTLNDLGGGSTSSSGAPALSPAGTLQRQTPASAYLQQLRQGATSTLPFSRPLESMPPQRYITAPAQQMNGTLIKPGTLATHV